MGQKAKGKENTIFWELMYGGVIPNTDSETF